MLLLDGDKTGGNDEEICYKIISNTKLDGWKKGKSQVMSNNVIINQLYYSIMYV